MGRIVNPRSKPPKFGMEELQQRIIEKKLKNPKIKEKYKEDKQYNLEMDYTERKKFEKGILSNWKLDRSYNDYNLFVESCLKKPVLDLILDYVKENKKKEIRILEDGPGEGHFLAGIKNRLEEKKIKCEITAISLKNNFKKEIKRDINNIYTGDVAKYVPDKKNDIIISLFGGFNYTTLELSKEVLLKYAYSLNKGGIGIFGIRMSLIEKVNPVFLKKAFEKRGFELEIIDMNYKVAEIHNLPRRLLYLKRIK